jgi:hypothetical protein
MVNKPMTLWVKDCPFKTFDVIVLQGVTYVVSGFSGGSDNPLTGVELQPLVLEVG